MRKVKMGCCSLLQLSSVLLQLARGRCPFPSHHHLCPHSSFDLRFDWV